ncbi:MAG: cytidine deaminase [Synergistaceae bacterium]|nr:cytidine deaminase [Synergistaceae bacterium]MBQ6435341.1 cytidine deaminase [Synergistaceae bacterium]MBQ6737100.1 cytidine deaminase [Synergistaceae bacterium]MBQ7068915.1 cytidine deaminase [Synergistaceae bacterium]MBR0075180.1 cytidine deaminase [Synergistaceae bacterium]
MSLKENWPSEKISPDDLLKMAREAADRAYVPYSHFHVGAALLFENDEVIKSCNVENSSYGVTICAERAGVVIMVSQGKKNPLAIAVAGSYEDKDDYLKVECPPCGACRQALAEFNKNMLVVMASKDGAKIFELKKLLPHSFSLDPEE